MTVKTEELRDTLKKIIEVREEVYRALSQTLGPDRAALSDAQDMLNQAAEYVRGVIHDQLAAEFLKGV